ncbi:uncharacterized protein THITE_2061081 [Thermothielavioides terrestris NRRL 8126]|uniref:Zn(2)-C6 fungal-type domain-containing protein n=1 Tax=Thermothielavioides terrestris (strain ATCC 38088 / NRRL 8126) TaxID=578455 RepID=G2QT46_THETT|nr:uncharacterized protein THITE_2061081 [Thermothielavioides terrestris NRRL 8126]AEO64372.1 hypothetical protein THITE_2061081 [Thermothielavioides terrestris NRRL 8126]
MERNGSAPARTSTYGQACMQCFKAKCRCLPRPGGGGCERCFRLGKDCQPSEAARRRNAQKTAAQDARIAQLEGKIDLLFSTIQSLVSSSGTAPHGLQLRQESSSNSTANARSTPSDSSGPSPSGPSPVTDGGPTPASGASSMRILTPGFPTSAEAEEALRFFRSQMLPCFPFLTLPPSLTGSQLRDDRPILFQAILTVTTFSAQRRLPRIEELKQLVFNSALMSSQSSMDLLLGLLTYIAWSTDAFLGRAGLLSRLMVLAISLVYDLRLFKPSRPDVQAIVAYTQGFPDDDPGAGDFMERQRAVLACFVLSSQISCHFGRIDALRWTPQMEDALRVVAANKSCPTDETFAAQVRLQLLTHRAVQVREQHDADSDRFRGGGTPTSSSISGLLYLNTLRTELQALRASLNLDADHPQPWPADLLGAHAYYTAVYLDQTALSLSPPPPHPPPQPRTHGGPTSSSARSTAAGATPGLERLTAFHRSAESIAGWLATFRRMPASRCLALPSHFWTQAVWCNAVLKHLSTHPDPALDCRAVRSRVDLLTTLDWMVAKLEAVSAEAAGGPGLVSSDDLFRLLARLFGRARVWAEARWDLSTALPQGQAGLGGQQAGHGADHCVVGTGQVDGRVPDVEDMSWMDSMDLENDKWLEDVLGWSPATT